MTQQLSFAPTPTAPSGWQPDAIPDLSSETELVLDFETTGLRWWAGDRPCGVGVGTLDGRTWYLPYRHAGGNLPEGQVLSFMKGLRGKRLRTLNGRFDIHMALVDGVDFEAQGCTVTDIGHWAGLIDDHRRHFSLESIGQDYLKRGKIQGLDKTRMAQYHASQVEAYAREDIALTRDVGAVMWPILGQQELHRVRELEDDVIYPTVEMERNGAPIDKQKLERWCRESERMVNALLWELTRDLGFKLEPNSPASVQRMFEKLGVVCKVRTTRGPSLAHGELDQYVHPTIQKVVRVRELISLRDKFLLCYRDQIGFGDLLRYSLHQMRGDRGGTVSGRFSSSAIIDGYGINVQQVTKPSKQRVKDFIIRELFVPREGLWLSADARQIEYRLFAHYSKSEKILAAYAADPNVDFHNLVMEMVQQVKPDINRNRTKDLNFAKLYGAGLKKIAVMLGYRSASAHKESLEGLADTRPFVDAYDSRFPEAEILLRKASKIAEQRGYVTTLLGRRAWFPNGEFLYAALNRVIQGTAADINKRKTVELYRTRKETGLVLRFSMHDEADGDVPDAEAARRVAEILDRQSFDLRVPILWDTKCGKSWAEAA